MKHVTLLIVLAVMALPWLGCGGKTPHQGTGIVAIALPSDEEAEMLAYLNQVMQGRVTFRLPRAGETPDVKVVYQPPAKMQGGRAWGLAYVGGDTAWISTGIKGNGRRDRLGPVVFHELLHCAGLHHEDIPVDKLGDLQIQALRDLGGRGARPTPWDLLACSAPQASEAIYVPPYGQPSTPSTRPSPSMPAGKPATPASVPRSSDVLRDNQTPGPDGLPNRVFYTREQAAQRGLRPYTSGPCRGYFPGEEWFCLNRDGGEP